jgi:ribosome maturation factor RimP
LSELVDQIEQRVAPLLEAEGVELVDLTYGKGPSGWTLCFYMDKSGGFTLSDCEVWTDRLGPVLDESGLIDRSYVLEISSPGLDRALRKTKDFERFAGQRVHVKLYAPLDGQKNFHGNLLGGTDAEIRLRTDEGRDVALQRSQVAKCKLDPEITF